MQAYISSMSGEELLLAAIYRGPLVGASVEKELERRALLGSRRDYPHRPHLLSKVIHESKDPLRCTA